MLLHLIDDEKIINRTIDSFEEALPGQNIFLCFVDSPIKYVQPRDNLYFVENSTMPENICKREIEAIIIHYLSYKKITFLQKNSYPKVPIYWIMWGSDYYNNILENKGYRVCQFPRYKGIKTSIKRFINLLGINTNTDKVFLEFVRDNVSYAIVFQQDFKLCCQYRPKIFRNIICIDKFFYYPIDAILGKELYEKKAKGNIVLVGNSCSFSNNHKYVFDYLKNVNVSNKKIVVPLSYGGNKLYKNKILDWGHHYFGKNFQPLLSFLPLKDYNNIMLQAGICIYGSWRQEANGNILEALYLGAKVFVSKRSSLLSYYQNMGITIFSLEDISQANFDAPLSEEQKNRNRLIIGSLFNKERQLGIIKEIWGDVNKQLGTRV